MIDISYIRSIWEHIRPIRAPRRPFLGFSDLRYHFNEKGA